MSFYSIPAWTVTAMLLSSPALAGHCDTEVAEAQAAANYAPYLQPSVEEVVGVLFQSALEACRLEEIQMASAEFDSPMLAPDYVSVGQSMLINIVEMIGAK
ncbi:hypothetical protein EA796_13965 [Pseudomonas sp. AOB-7]|uniref:hypothetical protein n=1 Tax=Pseudomonas sp. AOB-7 TaxID=2482750 RepID=UPI000EFB6A8E|nr:hypothetical protein [Pseudomonas sp. AOB-7]RMH84053.1 hypothetical protein EA796_13965 [Pseudomonas sp. AOB-7]